MAGVANLDLNSLIETKMLYAAERQKVLAQNVANVDVPGYRARDLQPLDFKHVLAAQMQKLPLATTSPLHMSGMGPGTERFASEVTRDAYEQTPTGNTVVVEEQMMKIAQNSTDYQVAVSLDKKVGNLTREVLGQQPTP